MSSVKNRPAGGGLEVVVLAAGEGTRMRSELPKCLVRICGRPMVGWVLSAARALRPGRIHVVVRPGEQREIARHAEGDDVRLVLQRNPLGTADALRVALAKVGGEGTLMVLCGDMPVLGPGTLRRIARGARHGLALLGTRMDNPTGYGRIVSDVRGRAAAIVEERDATPAEREAKVVYAGVMAGSASLFRRWIPRIGPSPVTGERYLTEIVRLHGASGGRSRVVLAENPDECLGVNSPEDYARAARALAGALVRGLMRQGARLHDSASVQVRGEVRCAGDVEIDANVTLEGRVALGKGVRIGPGCVLRDVTVGAGTEIRPLSHIEECVIGSGCTVGPFARIRDRVRVGEGARIGNFVEVKRSSLGAGSKASHLSYVGDAEVGAGANIGAGVITCNYDGAGKHRTVVGDRAFIGSGVELVAPVRVGDDAEIGAGSTVTEDVPPAQLSLARARQVNTGRPSRRRRKA